MYIYNLLYVFKCQLKNFPKKIKIKGSLTRRMTLINRFGRMNAAQPKRLCAAPKGHELWRMTFPAHLPPRGGIWTHTLKENFNTGFSEDKGTSSFSSSSSSLLLIVHLHSLFCFQKKIHVGCAARFRRHSRHKVCLPAETVGTHDKGSTAGCRIPPNPACFALTMCAKQKAKPCNRLHKTTWKNWLKRTKRSLPFLKNFEPFFPLASTNQLTNLRFQKFVT